MYYCAVGWFYFYFLNCRATHWCADTTLAHRKTHTFIDFDSAPSMTCFFFSYLLTAVSYLCTITHLPVFPVLLFIPLPLVCGFIFFPALALVLFLSVSFHIRHRNAEVLNCPELFWSLLFTYSLLPPPPHIFLNFSSFSRDLIKSQHLQNSTFTPIPSKTRQQPPTYQYAYLIA